MAAIPPSANEVSANPMAMSYGGIMPAQPLAQVMQEERDRAMAAQNQPVITGLAGHIRQCWTAARDAKVSTVEQRMIESVRARRGEYPPDKISQIREQGGSEIYAMLTSVKCRAAASWLRDVLMGEGGERPWTLRPTPVPDLDPALVEQLVQQAAAPITEAAMQGIEMPDEQVKQLMSQMYDSMQTELRTKARVKVDRMADKMEDQLAEGGWMPALSAFIDDITTFPAAVLKGPVVRKKPCLKWEQTEAGYEPQVTEELKLEWERVDPFRFYPSPSATTIDDGYMIEHHRLPRASFQEMMGVDGYDDAAIRLVLEDYSRGGLTNWMTTDAAKADAEGKSTLHAYNEPEGLIDAIQFWGNVQGKWLIEWGLDESEVPDPLKDYNVEAWLVGNYVIKATLNADPLMRKPYFKASYEEVPGSFWGNSVADLVRDTQTVVNAAARQLVNNMGVSSGPQVAINVDRIPQGEDVTQIYPWKIWQFQNDPMGNNSPPISFFSPDSRIQELMAVFEKFSQLADEYSGIPRYMTGDNPGGLGRTASGLSMLINNASKSIRQVLTNVDVNVLSPALERLYYYNMRYTDDAELKGDVHVVARGASSIMAKEAAQVRRTEFLAATANPVDLEIVGVEGRAAILREVAKSLDMEVDRVVPPLDVIKAKMAAQQMAQQQAQEAQMMAEQGGPSANGQELMDGAPVTDNFSPPQTA
jgi:hypothetical protein